MSSVVRLSAKKREREEAIKRCTILSRYGVGFRHLHLHPLSPLQNEVLHIIKREDALVQPRRLSIPLCLRLNRSYREATTPPSRYTYALPQETPKRKENTPTHTVHEWVRGRGLQREKKKPEKKGSVCLSWREGAATTLASSQIVVTNDIVSYCSFVLISFLSKMHIADPCQCR